MKPFDAIAGAIVITLLFPGTMTLWTCLATEKRSKRTRLYALLEIWVPWLWIMGIMAWIGPGNHMLFIMAGVFVCWFAGLHKLRIF